MSVPTVVTTPLTASDPGRPLLVVGPSLGTTTALRQPVAALLDVEVLGVDLPGHGASPVPDAPYTVPELAEAVLAAVGTPPAVEPVPAFDPVTGEVVGT